MDTHKMDTQREKYLVEEHNKKRLLEQNLKDIREILDITKEANRNLKYLGEFELQQKGLELDHELQQKGLELDQRTGTILAMRDSLIKVFSYLKNIKKLDSFMRSKHSNSILVLFNMFVEGDDLSELDDSLKEVAQRLRLPELTYLKGEEVE